MPNTDKPPSTENNITQFSKGRGKNPLQILLLDIKTKQTYYQ